MNVSLPDHRTPPIPARRPALAAPALLAALLVVVPASALAASSCPAAPTPEAMGDRLGLAIEFHVENPLISTEEETTYVLALAAAASTAGVRVTFGLGRDFLDDYATGTDSVTGFLLARTLGDVVDMIEDTYCQEVDLHADVADGLAAADIATDVKGYVRQLKKAGARVTVASAACNDTNPAAADGWVEGARKAHLKAVAGVVTYCQGSLDPSNSYYLPPGTCTPSTPTYCHDAAPSMNTAQRISVWKAASTSAWTTPDTSGKLVVIGGIGHIDEFGETNLPCLDELDNSTRCPPTASGALEAQADADALVHRLQRAQASTYRSGSVGDTAYQTFSTNVVANADYIAAIFPAIQGSLDSTPTLADATVALSSVTSFVTLRTVEKLNR